LFESKKQTRLKAIPCKSIGLCACIEKRFTYVSASAKILFCFKVKKHTSFNYLEKPVPFHMYIQTVLKIISLINYPPAVQCACTVLEKELYRAPPPLPTALFDRPDCIQASTTDQAYRPNLAFSLSFSPPPLFLSAAPRIGLGATASKNSVANTLH
jgi:hypothetical protein